MQGYLNYTCISKYCRHSAADDDDISSVESSGVTATPSMMADKMSVKSGVTATPSIMIDLLMAPMFGEFIAPAPQL
jgi:hypothetical protein